MFVVDGREIGVVVVVEGGGRGLGACSVAHSDEILAQLFRYHSTLLRHHGVLVLADDDRLDRLHDVYPAGAPLGPDDPVRAGEVHVLCSCYRDPVECECLAVVKVGEDLLDILLAHLEALGGGPDAAVVAGNDGLSDHLGGQKLVVHIALPGHAAA